MTPPDKAPAFFSDWYFSRKQLAQSYLKTLSSGVMLSTTIFAAKQTGTTSFLINDVMATADEEGYLAVYIDLSDPSVPVTASLLWAVEQVLSGSSVLSSSFNYFKGLFVANESRQPRAAEVLQKRHLIDADYFVINKDLHFQKIFEGMRKLQAYRSVIYIFDHAENLLKDDLARECSQRLREWFSNSQNRCKPLYASGDPQGWHLVFQDRTSPLYSEGALQHKLPALSKAFVRDVVLRSGVSVSMDEAINCFELTEQRPGIFIATLMGWSQHEHAPISSYFYEQLKTPAERDPAAPSVPSSAVPRAGHQLTS